MINSISKRQFDAYCYVRQPIIRALSKEVAWFEAADLKLLALIVFDKVDRDFGSVILGRDSRNLFRCIESPMKFFSTKDAAIEDLKKAIVKYVDDGQNFYPQGDESEPAFDIFKPVVDDSRMHDYYKILTNEPCFEAARNLIQEIAYSFVDVDGNYIQQFQCDGFDARLWEMFLYVYLYNCDFEFNTDHSAPDYYINKYGQECFIEAVTVGPNSELDAPNATTAEEIIELSKNYLPIKFGSALFSKLNKSPPYWEKEHVKGKPLIFAVHDYHLRADGQYLGSMTWSRAGLVHYLYGLRDEVEIGDDGSIKPVFLAPCVKPTVKVTKTKKHVFKHKEIPSNFFQLPDSENISAVMFSNAATITTFNRMGKLAGLGSKKFNMIRSGVKANPKKTSQAIPFVSSVNDSDYEEAWGDSIIMYHNPNAINPVNPDLFPDISHVTYDHLSGTFFSIQNPNEVMSSTTIVVDA